MIPLINKLLSWLFPKRRDAILVDDLSSEALLQKLNVTHTGKHRSLTSFRDPSIRACIHELKFHDNEKATDLLALLLREWLSTQPSPITIVPVPLSKQRQKERGYNQVSRVTKQAIKNLPEITCREDILKKIQHTVPQTSLDREARLKNVKGAFSLSTQFKAGEFSDTNFIILDDVITTGATLSEAKSELSKLKPAKITTVALSH